jgi:hypothetical protein
LLRESHLTGQLLFGGNGGRRSVAHARFVSA